MALGWATNESMIDAASARRLLSSWAHLCKEDAGIPDLSITEDDCDVDRESPLLGSPQLIESRRSCIRSAEVHAALSIIEDDSDVDHESPLLGWPQLMESRRSCFQSAEVHAAQWAPILSMPPAMGSTRLRMRTFRFSARAMEGLKSVANTSRSITKTRRRGGSKLPYSSLHSLGAHLWRSITRARNLSATSSTRCSFRPNDISNLDDTVPVRGTTTVGTLARRSLAFAAALLQEYDCEHHATAANLNGAGFFPADRDGAATVTSIQENINMVYMAKCEMMSQDSDFGWGSAVAMRSTSTSTSSRWEDGRVTLFGGEEDGTASIDAEIMLSREAMENMESDPAFMLSCS